MAEELNTAGTGKEQKSIYAAESEPQILSLADELISAGLSPDRKRYHQLLKEWSEVSVNGSRVPENIRQKVEEDFTVRQKVVELAEDILIFEEADTLGTSQRAMSIIQKARSVIDNGIKASREKAGKQNLVDAYYKDLNQTRPEILLAAEVKALAA